MCDIKKLCGLWGAHIVISEYNKNGTCPCIGCFGFNCKNCSTYHELCLERTDASFYNVLSRCQRCQLAATQKQR